MQNQKVRSNNFLTFDYKEAVNRIDGFFLDKSQVYEFADPLKMPQSRYLIFTEIYSDLEKGANNEFLNLGLDTIIKALNYNKIVDASHAAMIMKEAINNLRPLEHYYRLASVLFLVENENPFDYDIELNDWKIEQMKEVKNRLFFWNMLTENLKHLGLHLPKDILNYSQKAERKIAVYSQTLSLYKKDLK
ncbi:hypothetical protein V9L05_20605 [Bernardetia sp. Wsw4-3y2]|uniref:hypothetical protein n=1 Tax=Bernardetia sp. Wsw4-3y2 TaxID=3127471 RepID=UPI0030CD561B